MSSIYDFEVFDAKKAPYDMAQHKGHPVLIMNVASKCGYTESGYAAATELHKKYAEQGFQVLAFPCNQFGGQEPGSEAEVVEMVCKRFKADFPIMSKIDVNGDAAHPMWDYMKKTVPGILGTKSVKWNFTMFLCNGEGVPVERFSPGTKAKDIEKKLVPLL